MFRLTRVPDEHDEAASNCSDLLADPSIPTIIASAITEFVVSTQSDPAAFPEGKLQVKLWIEGREEGRQEGRQEARAFETRLVARFLPDHADELEAIDDYDEFRRRVDELMSGRG